VRARNIVLRFRLLCPNGLREFLGVSLELFNRILATQDRGRVIIVVKVVVRKVDALCIFGKGDKPVISLVRIVDNAL
jgi:hypothetical protein